MLTKKVFVLFVACFITVFLGLTSGASVSSQADGLKEKKWFMTYKGDREPDIRGAIVYSDGKTDHFARAYSEGKMEIVEPDILRINTLGTDKGTYFYKYTYEWNLDSDKGYEVEIKAKLNDADVVGYESAAHLDVEDSSKKTSGYWELSLIKLEDGKHYAVLAGKSRGKPLAIGKEFHVFRIEIKGRQATLFMDEEKQYSVELRDDVNTNQIRFGDLTNKADADWEIDYIKIAKP